MNVLHMAYGFLEWSDGIQTETSFAPLILCEATSKSDARLKAWSSTISGTGDDPAINAVLAEKLRLDFGVELPAVRRLVRRGILFRRCEASAPEHDLADPATGCHRRLSVGADGDVSRS